MPTAAAVIRELEGKRTPGAKSWRLEVAGTWSEPPAQQQAWLEMETYLHRLFEKKKP